MEESILDKKGKEGSLLPILIILIVSLLIAGMWDKNAVIKNTAHSILDPSAGALLDLNVIWGMLLLVLILSIIMTIVQKYATDQVTLKEMKMEQKKLSEEMKKVKDNPSRMMELQKESMKFMMPMMKLSMRGIIYTGIPLILMFRWFMDYFSANPYKFFGFMTWLWFYLIASIVFSSILRKYMDVV
ncbi:hypothetical protein COU57_04320 [Candidatus Pacearchaeota archaeon CG10_big_fil_rev_8_21_14_0_10_32_14]|nr:MAG: hypothetical protein COU57_04320 [Candidatus Pacearchaeota archaeon CG10_big_fil_rev_8_21_14_0_10_32_14]